MEKIPCLAQYQGSKRLLSKQILRFFPKEVETLFDPFCGLGSITIASAKAGIAKHYVMNDLNESVSALLKSCIDNPTDLCKEYEDIWNGQFDFSSGKDDYFKYARSLLNGGDKRPGLFLFVLARTVKGAVRYNPRGEYNQSCDKRRKGTNPAIVKKNAFAISSLLSGKTEVLSLDFSDVMSMANKGDLVYLDPPYQGVGNKGSERYFSFVPFEKIVSELQKLKDRGVPFVLSYDGKTGDKTFGKKIPDCLDCRRIELKAGISAQSTLMGRSEETVESLYVSNSLFEEEKTDGK